MRELITTAIDARLAEHDVLHTHLVLLVYVLRAVEPHKVYHPMSVAEMANDALLARSLTELLKRQNLSFQLHERHIGLQLVDAIDAAAVNVFIGVILQQLTPRRDAELLLQNLGAPRSHAGQVLDILVEDVQC